jgi:hypothetical protein
MLFDLLFTDKNHLSANSSSPPTAAKQINFVGVERNVADGPPRVASAASMCSAESRRLSYQSARSRMAGKLQ